MKSLHDVPKPWDRVFDPQERDAGPNLTDLVDDRINSVEFFSFRSTDH